MHFKGEACFIKKTYQIYVESATYINSGEVCFLSTSSCIQHSFKGKATVEIGNRFQLSVIDVIYEMEQKSDNQVFLEIFLGDSLMGKVNFDLDKQKIKSVQSKTIFKKEFSNRSGFIYYKFFSCSTSIVRKEDFELDQSKKSQFVSKMRKKQEDKIQSKQSWEAKIVGKDKIIMDLKEKLSVVETDHTLLKQKLQNQLCQMKKGMKINTNVVNLTELKNYQKKIQTYESTIKMFQRKLATIEEQNEDLYDRINNLLKERMDFLKRSKSVDDFRVRQKKGSQDNEFANKFELFEQNFIRSMELTNQKLKEIDGQKSQIYGENSFVLMKSRLWWAFQNIPYFRTYYVLKKCSDQTVPFQQQSPKCSKQHRTFCFVLNNKEHSLFCYQITQYVIAFCYSRTITERAIDEGNQKGNMLSETHLLPVTPCFSLIKKQNPQKLVTEAAKWKGDKSKTSKVFLQQPEDHVIRKSIYSSKVIMQMQNNIKNKNEIENSLKQQIKNLKEAIAIKQNEIKVLKEEIKNGNSEKVKQKQVLLNKNLKFMQNEKAKFFSGFSNNSEGNINNIDAINALKELGNDNKELIKENRNFIKEIDNLKAKISYQQEKLMKISLNPDKKQQQKFSQFNSIQQVSQKKEIPINMSQNNIQINNFYENQITNSHLNRMKSQVNSFESELRTIAEQNKRLKKQKELLSNQIFAQRELNSDAKKQIQKLSTQVSLNVLQSRMLKTQLTKMDEQYKQSVLIYKKYFQLEKKFSGIEKIAIKVEHQLNKKIDLKDIEYIQGELSKVVNNLLETMNLFQTDFYSTLENSFQVCSMALQKYYKELVQIQTEKLVIHANYEKKQRIKYSKEQQVKLSEEQMKKLIKRKDDELRQEKQRKKKIIDEQINTIKQKKSYKKLTLKDQIQSFQEKVKKVESTLKELWRYRNELKNYFESQGKNYMNSFPKMAKDFREVKNMKPNNCLKISQIIGNAENKIKKMEEQALTKKQKSYSFMVDSKLKNSFALKNTVMAQKSLGNDECVGFSMLGISIAQKFSLLKNSLMTKNMKNNDEGSAIIVIPNMTKINADIFQQNHTKQKRMWEYEKKEKQLLFTIEKLKRQYEKELNLMKKTLQSLQQTSSLQKNKLLKEKEELMVQINQLTDELKQSGQFMELTDKQNEDLRSTCIQLKESLIQKIDSEQELTEEIMKLSGAYKTQENNLKELIVQRTTLFQGIQTTQNKQIQKLKLKIQRLQQDLQAEIMHSAQLCKQKGRCLHDYEEIIDKLTTEQVQLKENIQSLAKQCKQISEEKQVLWQENQKLRNTISVLVQKNEENQLDILKMGRMIESFEQERQAMSKLDIQLHRQVEQKRRQWLNVSEKQRLQIHKWEENYNKLEIQARMLAEQQKKAKEKLVCLKNDIQKYQRKIDDKEKQIIKLQKQISVKEIDNFKLVQELQLAAVRKKQEEKKICELQMENERLHDQINQMETNRDSKNSLTQSKAKNKKIVSQLFRDSQCMDQFLSVGSSRKKITNFSALSPSFVNGYSKQSIHEQQSVHLKQRSALTQQMHSPNQQQFDYTTPLVEFMKKNQEFQEFSEHSISQLIEEIRTLRVKAERLVANLEAKQEENNRLVENLKQRVAEAYKLMEDMKRLQKSEKDLRMEIVKHEAREKKYEKELKEKKQALSQQQRQGNLEVKEMVKFSQLASQLQLENQKLRWEISQGVLSEEQRQSYAKGIKAFETVLKEGKSFFGSENNPLSAEVVTLKKELASVREQLAEKCDALQELEKRNTSEAGVKYKQKYDNLAKEMKFLTIAYRKLEQENYSVKSSLDHFNKQLNLNK